MSQTTRDRIVTYAETVKDRGGTYREAAKKLDVSTSTLWRYRKARGKPGQRTKKKMNRGGKLTQLENALYDEGEGGPPSSADTDEMFSRPLLPPQATSRMAKGRVKNEEEIVQNNTLLLVRARKYVMPNGDERWVVGGEQDVGSLEEVREFDFGIAGGDEDLKRLAGIVRDRLTAEGIMYP